MDSGFVEITERRGKGTRGGSYVYVAEESDRRGTLVHIGVYAFMRRESDFEDITYSVPASSLSDKTLLRFSFSGSILPSVEIGRIKGTESLEIEWERLTPRKLVERFRGYRYEFHNEELKRIIEEFEEEMVP